MSSMTTLIVVTKCVMNNSDLKGFLFNVFWALKVQFLGKYLPYYIHFLKENSKVIFCPRKYLCVRFFSGKSVCILCTSFEVNIP